MFVIINYINGNKRLRVQNNLYMYIHILKYKIIMYMINIYKIYDKIEVTVIIKNYQVSKKNI